MDLRLTATGLLSLAAASLGSASGFVTPARAQAVSRPAAETASPAILATTMYVTDQGPRIVTVRKREVPAPSSATFLRYLDKHPDKGAFPNIVLYAVDAPVESSSKGTVVWISYDSLIDSAEQPVWGADVTIDPTSRGLRIVTFKSISINATLAIYDVNPNASINVDPGALVAETVEKWPAGQEPVSVFKMRMRDPRACFLRSINAAATFTGAFIVGIPDRPFCPTVYVEYDAASKAWREVTVAALAPSR